MILRWGFDTGGREGGREYRMVLVYNGGWAYCVYR